MLRFIQAIWNAAEAVGEFLFWRDDCERSWSPVSFWLAVLSRIALAILGVAYGHAIWGYARRSLGAAP
jgi:hypothetical protein